MDTLVLKEEWIVKCKNCGHDCHCGKICKQDHLDGDNKPITIDCCPHCRCKDEI